MRIQSVAQLFEPELTLYRREQWRRIRMLVDRMPERSRTVFHLRFEEGQTLDQIGAQIGVGKERIRQIEARIVRDLRKLFGVRILRPAQLAPTVVEPIPAITQPTAPPAPAITRKRISRGSSYDLWEIYTQQTLMILKSNLRLLGTVNRDNEYLFAKRGMNG